MMEPNRQSVTFVIFIMNMAIKNIIHSLGMESLVTLLYDSSLLVLLLHNVLAITVIL